MEETNALFMKNNKFLTNSFPCKISYNSFEFESAESAFGAQKNPDYARDFIGLSGYQARKLADQIKATSNGDTTKHTILQEITFQKFLQNIDLRIELFKLKDADILSYINHIQNISKKINSSIIEVNLSTLLVDVRKQLMEIKIPKLPKDFIFKSCTKDIIDTNEVTEIKLEYTLLKDDPFYNFFETKSQYQTNKVLKIRQKYPVEIVVATGIIFSDEPGKLLINCPVCGNKKELIAEYDKKAQLFRTNYNFCEYCGNEIDGKIVYKM